MKAELLELKPDPSFPCFPAARSLGRGSSPPTPSTLRTQSENHSRLLQQCLFRSSPRHGKASDGERTMCLGAGSPFLSSHDLGKENTLSGCAMNWIERNRIKMTVR